MTIPEPLVNSPSCRYPIGIGESTAHAAHDGDDDELQRFSKGVAALLLKVIDAVMGWKYRNTSATNSDAHVKLGVPTSSRTSPPARTEIAVPPGRGEPAVLNTPHPRNHPQDLGECQCSTQTRRSR